MGPRLMAELTSVGLLPGVALVQGCAVPRDVEVKLVQALRPLHGRKDVIEILISRKQSAPTSVRRLGDHAVDGDLVGRHTGSVRHSVDEGGPDPAHIVVERACRGIERDERGDPLGVRALEAGVAPAVEERGAPRRARVRGAGLDRRRVGAVVVARAQRAVGRTGDGQRVLARGAHGAVRHGRPRRARPERPRAAVDGIHRPHRAEVPLGAHSAVRLLRRSLRPAVAAGRTEYRVGAGYRAEVPDGARQARGQGAQASVGIVCARRAVGRVDGLHRTEVSRRADRTLLLALCTRLPAVTPGRTV
jgi:hypothetical protein